MVSSLTIVSLLIVVASLGGLIAGFSAITRSQGKLRVSILYLNFALLFLLLIEGGKMLDISLFYDPFIRMLFLFGITILILLSMVNIQKLIAEASGARNAPQKQSKGSTWSILSLLPRRTVDKKKSDYVDLTR